MVPIMHFLEFPGCALLSLTKWAQFDFFFVSSLRKRHRPVSHSDRKVSVGHSSDQGTYRDFNGNCCSRCQLESFLSGTQAEVSGGLGHGRAWSQTLYPLIQKASLFFLLLRNICHFVLWLIFFLLGNILVPQTHGSLQPPWDLDCLTYPDSDWLQLCWASPQTHPRNLPWAERGCQPKGSLRLCLIPPR